MQKSNIAAKAVFAVSGETRKEQVVNAAKEIIRAHEFVSFCRLREMVQDVLSEFNIRPEFLGECLRLDDFFGFYKNEEGHMIYRAEIYKLLRRKIRPKRISSATRRNRASRRKLFKK
jgi:hypothetical protein